MHTHTHTYTIMETFTYVTTLTRRRLDLKQLDDILYKLLFRNDVKWKLVQLDGIHQTRYFVRKWMVEERLPRPTEFKLFNACLKRWFSCRNSQTKRRDTSCDVMHLLWVVKRCEVYVPEEIVRYIWLYLGKKKPPSLHLL